MNSELSSIFEAAKETHSSLSHTHTHAQGDKHLLPYRGWAPHPVLVVSFPSVCTSTWTEMDCCWAPWQPTGAILHHCGPGRKKKKDRGELINNNSHFHPAFPHCQAIQTHIKFVPHSCTSVTDTWRRDALREDTVIKFFQLDLNRMQTQNACAHVHFSPLLQQYIGEDKWNILVNTNISNRCLIALIFTVKC